MVRLLIDTCVWLDLVKDPEHDKIINVLEELIKEKELTLIVPRTVVEEFIRNKERIVKESGKSLSSVFKRVKEAVSKFGDPQKKQTVIEQLNNVDYKIPALGEAASEAVGRIEKLLNHAVIIEATDDIKLHAAQRAINKRAPFHKEKNSFNDAILIETYAKCLKDKNSVGVRFGFVTHNTKDFSEPNGNEKIPHADFQGYFTKIKSRYFIKLTEALHKIRPDLVSELMIEEEWMDDPRSLSEILEMESELVDKIWYNRHQYRAYQIKKGHIKLIDRKDFTLEKSQSTIVIDIWEGAKKAAKKVEKKYGKENLSWDDFEWGMINGKLSALRWVTGYEWDNLDT